MASPTTTKQWTISGTSKGFDELQFQAAAPIRKVGETEVLVRLHGASLNYRDLIIPRGEYPFPIGTPPIVPGSDGAGVVEAVGSKVTGFKEGDRVTTLFNQGHQYGNIDIAAAGTGLGGALDGTLRQWAVLPETGVVASPRNLSHVESATLTCAGLTSWNALYGLRPVKPGDVVLVQGTGGVSVFALQFAKAAGATVIATTSTAAKAEKLRRLGADHVINYREDPNWGETARRLTKDQRGVDHIIEVGGLGTFQQSLRCVRMEGIITVVGFLGGKAGEDMPSVMSTLNKLCTVRGVYVGSRAQMQDMVDAIEANDIHPVLDEKEFTLEQLRGAYEYMWAQSHVGKIAINIE